MSWSAPADTGRPPVTGNGVQYRQRSSGRRTDCPHADTRTTATITSVEVGTTLLCEGPGGFQALAEQRMAGPTRGRGGRTIWPDASVPPGRLRVYRVAVSSKLEFATAGPTTTSELPAYQVRVLADQRRGRWRVVGAGLQTHQRAGPRAAGHPPAGHPPTHPPDTHPPAVPAPTVTAVARTATRLNSLASLARRVSGIQRATHRPPAQRV